MSETPKNYGPLLHRIAAAHACTELAVFDVTNGPDQIRLLYRASGSANRAEQEDDAVKAFKDIIARHCLPTGKDALIQVVESTPPDRPQFCLVTLAHRAGKLVGAAGFVKRLVNERDAKVELQQIQYEAERFRKGPPAGTAG